MCGGAVVFLLRVVGGLEYLRTVEPFLGLVLGGDRLVAVGHGPNGEQGHHGGEREGTGTHNGGTPVFPGEIALLDFIEANAEQAG